MFKKSILIVFALVFCLMTSVQAANIICVGEDTGDDSQWTAVLEDAGYSVNYIEDYWASLDSGKIAQLESADLIIVLNSCNSGNYDDGPEEQQWNAITTPLLLQNVNIARNSRWQFLDSSDRPRYDDALMEAVVPSHAIFDGITLDPNNQVDISDESVDNIRVNGGAMGNGTTLGTEASSGDIIVGEWAPGVPYYDGSMTPGGPRMLFLGVAEDGQYNLNAAGEKLYLNIIKYMLGFNKLAQQPSPAAGEEDVLLGITLSWKAGQYGNTHNVFFGTDIDAVANATEADPLDTISSIGQSSTTFDPGSLAYGTTYYWRVDEVNAPSAPALFEGNVWSFTTELLAYPLDTDSITATASAPAYEVGTQDPNATCDGSGLDDSNDMHSNDPSTMYLCDIMSGPGWIQYEFDKSYMLYDMLIWNYNEEAMGADLGVKDVNIAYSEDGQTWTDLSGTFVIEKAPGDNTCGPNPPIVFGGKVAKYVKLTLKSNYIEFIASAGISEVRFSAIPMRASEPDPSDNASNVSINPTLSWRRGRGVIEHNVYLGSDEAAVEDGTADSTTVTESSYTPSTLMLDTTYYWRVDEVNSLADYPTWSSDVWSFSTEDALAVDDFEAYTDTQPDTVWDTWIDGITDSANGGSRMGHEFAPFCEQDIVHGGNQSAPMHYDNTSGAISQVVANTANLAIGSNWTAIGGADTLVIWFRGTETNAATDQIFVKLGSTKFVYDGPASDISRTAWTKWEISLAGANLSNVSTMTIGVERIGGAGGVGDIYVDDIELLIGVVPVDPGTANLVAHYDMENNVNDSSGNALNGTPNGALSYAAGKSGMAAVFDGTDATYVDLPIGNLISTLTDCTISTWVNWTPGDTSQWTRIFDFGTGTSTNFFLTPYANNNRIRAAIKLSDAVGEQQADGADGDSGMLEANNWQHLAVVIDTSTDPNTMKLYLNGDLIGTRNNLTTLPMDLGVTNQNYLGKSQWPDPAFSGMIDDFRIYDRAFSAGEVKYLAEN